MTKRVKIILSVVAFVLIAVIAGITIWRVVDTQWERTFDITYQGYVDEEYSVKLDNPYKKYTITNKSNKTHSSIYAVIQVKTWEGKKFTFEKIIHFKLEAKASTEFRIWNEDIKSELDKRNLSPFMYETEIIKIKYK